MGTYTVAPTIGVPPSIVGLISLNPATETGTDDGLFADGGTDRVFIPGGLTVTSVIFDLTVSGTALGTPQSGVRMQTPDTTVSFIHTVDWPSGTTSFSHVVADDAGLLLGSLPYPVPPGGVFLWVEFDANSPGNVTSGLVTIGYQRRRWTVGSAGWS